VLNPNSGNDMHGGRRLLEYTRMWRMRRGPAMGRAGRKSEKGRQDRHRPI